MPDRHSDTRPSKDADMAKGYWRDWLNGNTQTTKSEAKVIIRGLPTVAGIYRSAGAV